MPASVLPLPPRHRPQQRHLFARSVARGCRRPPPSPRPPPARQRRGPGRGCPHPTRPHQPATTPRTSCSRSGNGTSSKSSGARRHSRSRTAATCPISFAPPTAMPRMLVGGPVAWASSEAMSIWPAKVRAGVLSRLLAVPNVSGFSCVHRVIGCHGHSRRQGACRTAAQGGGRSIL